MGKIKNAIQKAKEIQDKAKDLESSEGTKELKKLGETLLGKEKKESKLQSDVAKEYVGSELEELEDKVEAHESKERRKGFVGGMVTGALGLLGYKTLSGESKEMVDRSVETGEQATEIFMKKGPEAEKKRKDINDAIMEAKELNHEAKELQEKAQLKFKLEKKAETFFEKAEKYGAEDYKMKNVLQEAWAETEFLYDEEGNIEKKRGWFGRLFAFLPLFFQKSKNREIFQKLRKNGTLDQLKSAKKSKEEIEKEIDELKEDVKEVKKSKQEVGRSFKESPGILWSSKEVFRLSKTYKQELRELAKMAGGQKMTKKEIQKGLQNIVDKYRKIGIEKGGKSFLNNAKLKEHFPGFKVSETAMKSKKVLKGNVAFRLVEISGKALGAFLRTGRHEGIGGGLEAAKDMVTDADTWKDACPIWGTIRSFEKLDDADGRSKWSKWLEVGFSLGMDVAMIVGIIGSFGTATAGLAGARTAGMASFKGVAKKQLIREAEEMGSKESLTFFRKNAVRMAGGKWVVGFNLVATVAEEMFSDNEIDEFGKDVKKSIIHNQFETEQEVTMALLQGRDRQYIEQIRAAAAEEEKKRKKKLEKKEELISHGHIVEAEDEVLIEKEVSDEETEKPTEGETDIKEGPKDDKKETNEKDVEVGKESVEKVKKTVAN